MAETTTSSARTPVDLLRIPFETSTNRRRIIASYWVVVLLAIPLWWRTTSIDRLSLPDSRVKGLEGKQLHFPLNVNVRVDGDAPRSEGLSRQLQQTLGDAAEKSGLAVTVDHGVAQHQLDSGNYEITLTSAQQTTIEDRKLHIGSGWGSDTVNGASALVANLLTPYSYQAPSEEHRTVKYAPRYRLAFTLLNEDASSGQGALSWDVNGAIHEYLQPTLDRMSVLHNFTIESQVQYHAPLAFTPRSLEEGNQQSHGLTPEDLTVFINSAEWTLASSVSNDPVLHFVLFVPSSSNSPLYILDNAGVRTFSDAFILPQWGGIVLLNNPHGHLTSSSLNATFQTFQRQLLALLGVPSLPAGVASKGPEPFSDWQFDALVRHRARQNFENSKETLSSIVALVHQIENMPVGQDVKGDVQNALSALDAALAAAPVSPSKALRHSSEALTLSSRAFFNPGMLALLYFPAEHKYAVYTPLFASIAAPLVAAVIREVAAWRKARRGAQQPAQRQKTD